MNDAMSGIEFYVAGTVLVGTSAYAILVDELSSLYFPIQCVTQQTALIDGINSGEHPCDIDNLGIYFTFLSTLKAHNMFPTHFSVTFNKKGGIFCCVDLVEDNELGVKVSRVPVTKQDMAILSSIGKIPIVIYGTAGTEFAFRIDKGVPKKNIFSFVCEEIARAEKMKAIGSSGD